MGFNDYTKLLALKFKNLQRAKEFYFTKNKIFLFNENQMYIITEMLSNKVNIIQLLKKEI